MGQLLSHKAGKAQLYFRLNLPSFKADCRGQHPRPRPGAHPLPIPESMNSQHPGRHSQSSLPSCYHCWQRGVPPEQGLLGSQHRPSYNPTQKLPCADARACLNPLRDLRLESHTSRSSLSDFSLVPCTMAETLDCRRAVKACRGRGLFLTDAGQDSTPELPLF